MDNLANPLKREPTVATALSLAAAVLMVAASLAGLFFQSTVYPTEAIRQSFVSNDLVNLLIGLPVLIASILLARRGWLLGLLFWPGALLYITYNYLAYALSLSQGLPFIVYLALVVLSIAAIIALLPSLDASHILQRLSGKVPERLAGGVLAGFGILFFVWRGSLLVQSLAGQGALVGPELMIAVADVLVTPVWVIGGVLLWRRRAWGYAAGTGLLFQGSMLFIGLLIFFVLQPVLSGVPFPLNDFVAVFIMGLIYFIPFGLFLRGVVRGSSLKEI